MKIILEFSTGKRVELTQAELQELFPVQRSVLAPFSQIVGKTGCPEQTVTFTSGYIAPATS